MNQRCVLRGQCLMPGPHSSDECHDVVMVEAQNEAHAAEMREWPAEKWAEQLRQCADAITENPARRELTLTSLARDIEATWTTDVCRCGDGSGLSQASVCPLSFDQGREYESICACDCHEDNLG